MSFGGYAQEGGRVVNCAFLNNTFLKNGVLSGTDAQIGDVNILWASTCTLKNNIFYVVKEPKTNGPVALSNIDKNSFSNIIFDYNIWYTTEGPKKIHFIVDNNKISGFKEWQALGFDKNSLFVNPSLRDAVNYPPGLHLRQTSKAKNAGDPAFTKAPGETDIDGDSRIKEGRVNCGADE
ncbi:MAG: hypothetical protein KKH91_02775 [Elusimicrobia bacterium]|nr:hypothetical protein [Elusimicrobiota bacterium]MBU2614046.1 hypothetical protein [Elusimicrobiota bacterium]